MWIVLLLACGSSAPTPTVEQLPVSEVATSFTNAEGQLVCPVMGDVIDSREAAVGHTEHDGTVYYFCCDSCQHMFADDPERYVNGRFIAHLEQEHAGRFGDCRHVL